MKKINTITMILLILAIGGCKSIDTYDMVYLNDPDMNFGSDGAKNFENYMESIREGANPTGGSKSNGGCGCN